MRDAGPAATAAPTLEAALLDYFEAPGKYQLSLRQPALLFASVREILQIAAGRGPAACAGRPRDAAMFFIRAALLYPGADHYAVLGFARATEPKDLKERYRLLMRLIHPDYAAAGAHAWPADAAVRVNRAYEVLSSPVLRRDYDEQLTGRVAQRPPIPAWPSQAAARRPPERRLRMGRTTAWLLGLALTAAGLLMLLPRQEPEHLVQRARPPAVAPAPPRPAVEPAPPPAAMAIAVPPAPLPEPAQPQRVAAAPDVPPVNVAPASPPPGLARLPTAPAAPLMPPPPVAAAAPVSVAMSAPVPAPLPVPAPQLAPAPLLAPAPAPVQTPALMPARPVRVPAPAPPAIALVAPAAAVAIPAPQASAAAPRPVVTAAIAPPAESASRPAAPVAHAIKRVASMPTAAAVVVVPTLGDAQPLLTQLLQQLESGSGEQVLGLLDAEARHAPGAQALSRQYEQLVRGGRPVRLSQVEFQGEPRGGVLLVTGRIRLHAGEPTIGAFAQKLLLRAEFSSHDGQVRMTGLSGASE